MTGRGEIRWTGPKKRALEAFFIHNGRARRSNTTDATAGLVYWQSFDWLLHEALIGPTVDLDGHATLTESGWLHGGQLWNVPRSTLNRMMHKAHRDTKTERAS